MCVRYLFMRSLKPGYNWEFAKERCQLYFTYKLKIKLLVQTRWVSTWHTISDWHSYQPEISSLDEKGTLLEQMSTAICRALQLLKAKLNGVLPWVFALGEESIGNQHEISVARTNKKSLLDTTVFLFPRYNLFKYHQNSCSPACICI